MDKKMLRNLLVEAIRIIDGEDLYGSAEKKEVKKIGYGDVITAITNSGMSSYYVSKVSDILKTNASADYYEACIAIINSNLSDYSKYSNIHSIGYKFN